MKKVAMIGGSGFVGQALMRSLLENGYHVRIVSRKSCDYKRAESRSYQPSNPASLKPALAGADVVVNLVGILNSRIGRDKDFYEAHVKLTQHIIDACQANSIRRYLHISALNADIKGPSFYLRTKGEAEALAHSASDMLTTSFQPSVIFGPGDGILNKFAKLLKFSPPIFPLACATTVFAPVYIGDVVKHIVDSIPQESSQRIQLCGPERYTLAEIVEMVARLIGRNIRVLALPDAISKLQAYVCNWVPGKPFSLDNYYSLQLDSVCTQSAKCPTLLSQTAASCLRH